MPANAGAVTPLPLVILLHGYGVTAESDDLVLPFSREVGARGFLYAQPNGTLDRSSKRFWNATDACCNYDHLAVDDVAFLRALIADVNRAHPVDPARVFLIGHSNGGFMALRMACEAGDLIAGVVSLAGATWLDGARCPSGRPVSVLQVHGTADAVIGYGGGATRLAPYPSARVTTEAFAARNGCSGPRVQLGTSDFLGDATAETVRDAATGCLPGGRAELWSVAGGGHIPIFHAAWSKAVLDWLLVPSP